MNMKLEVVVVPVSDIDRAKAPGRDRSGIAHSTGYTGVEEVIGVCYTCGCKLPYEDHGDPNNIVEEHLKKSGQTETIKKAGVEQAKKNLLELLEIQKNAGDLANPKKDYN